MNDGESLLKAILANPDEDTPRLMYADWLQENAKTSPCGRCRGRGREWETGAGFTYEVGCQACNGVGTVPDGHAERAEFIRLQIALQHPLDRNAVEAEAVRKHTARMSRLERGDPNLPHLVALAKHRAWREAAAERERLVTRSRQLSLSFGLEQLPEGWAIWPTPFLPAQERQWSEENRRPAAKHGRGFVSEVTCSVEDWFKYANSLVVASDCPACKGTGKNRGVVTCPVCRGMGNHTPIPTTAQPITKVYLTGLPEGVGLDWAWRSYINTHVADDIVNVRMKDAMLWHAETGSYSASQILFKAMHEVWKRIEFGLTRRPSSGKLGIGKRTDQGVVSSLVSERGRVISACGGRRESYPPPLPDARHFFRTHHTGSFSRK